MKILVLFDIDGTILKFNNELGKRIFIDFLEKYLEREIPQESIPDFSGMTDLKILQQITEYINLPFKQLEQKLPDLWESLNSYFGEYCVDDNFEVMPGVRQLIDELHSNQNVTLGLLTGNIKQNAYSKLKAVGLDHYFSFGSFGCEYADRNKLPQVAIEKANTHLSKNHFKTENTIILGDSPRDIECAKSNNIPVICTATGNFSTTQLENFKPDYLFEDFSDYKLVMSSIFEHFKVNYE